VTNLIPTIIERIAILSCFGKLFTNILNKRLNEYLECHNLLNEEQAGFRSQYGTTDHMFSLKMLIGYYLSCSKKLYCAFVDYRKAFDSVNRLHLWHKLLSHNINGKCLGIIYNMYSKVKVNCELTSFFSSFTGVRQGENRSPILFSIFLNDLSEFVSNKYTGLVNISNATLECLSDDVIDVYVKLFLLLYADDTVL
jgi:hypothetical protein